MGDHRGEHRVGLGVAVLPGLREQRARPRRCGPRTRPAGRGCSSAAGLSANAGDLLGEGARVRGVAGDQHPVDRAQQPRPRAPRGSALRRDAETMAIAADCSAVRRRPCARRAPRAGAASSASGPGGGGGEMPQRGRLVLDQLGRAGVQAGATRRADLVVDGGGDRAGARTPGPGTPRVVVHAQQAGGAASSSASSGCVDVRQRGGGRQRAARAENGDRLEQRGRVRPSRRRRGAGRSRRTSAAPGGCPGGARRRRAARRAARASRAGCRRRAPASRCTARADRCTPLRLAPARAARRAVNGCRTSQRPSARGRLDEALGQGQARLAGRDHDSTRSATSRRTTNSSARSDGASAQWASSIDHARPGARPRSEPSSSSSRAPAPTWSPLERGGGSPGAAQAAGRATPNGRSRSDSSPLARSTVTSSSGAEEALDQRGLADARRRPRRARRASARARTCCQFASSSAPSSWRRPTKTDRGAAPTCGCVAMALADSTPTLLREAWSRMGIPLSRMPCHAAYGPP